jgi:AbrB family looped-hinge helix DNA binding protein
MQQTSRVTIKGQVTIPKAIRESLDIKVGDLVLFVDKGNNVILKPAKTLLDLKGAIKTDKKPKSWREVREAAKKDVIKETLDK